MHLIVYLSDYRGEPEQLDAVLADIVKTAKARNAQLGITGVLFFHQGRFLQVIEGEKESLHQLMQDIARDPRHANIHYLVNEPVGARGFAAWNMDSFKLSPDVPLDKQQMVRITQAYKANLLTRSDTLVTIYRSLLAEGIFQEAA